MNAEKEILYVTIEEVIPNRFQPRLSFDEASLKELAESIKQHGIIQPLVVRKIEDKYEIIAGERRYKAATIAGRTKIPVVVAELDDKQSAEVALIENVQRKDLTAIEEARSYQKILDMGQTTQEQLAERIGLSQAAISNKLRLLNLTPEVQDALMKGNISERHARSLLTLKEAKDQNEMLNQVITQRMTVRQLDKAINEKLGIPEQPEVAEPTPVTPPKPEPVPESKPLDELLKPATPDPVNIEIPMTPVEPEIAKEEKLPEVFTPTSETPPSPLPPSSSAIPELGSDDVKSQFSTSMAPPEPEINPIINEAPEIPIERDSTFIAAGDFKAAINSVRSTVKTIEKYGFKLDTEEFDFENQYQIIIKIDKTP